ncbi:MAG: phospho-N-acetylmuramoyl-pentapeptide-transferase [Chloroflexi bacterium]|nr:phospho-N-acetylmuramoyl-pentapeptide-transferase [Chloroflexota bacterium]
MIGRSLAELARACGAVPSTGAPLETRITAVSSDTRQLSAGSLFVALKGERFDGHAFLAAAAEKGAAAAVVSEAPDTASPAPLPLLVVDDTLKALGDLARSIRRLSDVRVVGITGSVGKTTTKEMTALVLGARYGVLKSDANENNEVGVPNTLLRLNPAHGAAVIEMGMRGPGEIEYLSRIAEPDVAVITVIGESHIGRLGSLEAIADAKSEILAGLRPDGVAVLNRDDPFYDRIASRASRVTSFGTGQKVDVAARHVVDKGLEGVQFRCRTWEAEAEVRLSMGGAHMVTDALAAIAAGLTLGVPLDAAAEALSGFVPVSGRGRLLGAPHAPLVIDDAYNATPISVEAALRLMLDTPGHPRRIAVLGDILEMGGHAEEGHRRVGRAAAGAGPETHQAKKGTPTLGGIAIVLAAAAVSLFYAAIYPGRDAQDVVALTVLMLATSLLGFWDDYLILSRGRSAGQKWSYKLAAQMALAGVFCAWIWFHDHDLAASRLVVPGSNQVVDLGFFWFPAAIIFMSLLSNGVNLSDGLDGLAGGLSLIALVSCAAVALVEHVPHLAVFALALGGACLGFLWYNCHPARIFMGNTSSIALGMSLSAVAVVLRQELLLLLTFGVFLAEALSVMIQVGYYKLTHRRVFLKAPIHHHFEMLGWKETKVVTRFWIIAVVLAVLTQIWLR